MVRRPASPHRRTRTPHPERPARRRRYLVLALVAVGLVLATASPASAHAEFIGANPADGSVVATAPTEITLQFTEDVSVQPDGIRVLDDGGERVDRSEATSSGDTVTVPVEEDLDDGSYLVAWRVVSADGHPVHAAFTFSVGQESELSSDLAGQAFADSADRRDEIVGAGLRVLAYVGALTAAGLVVVGGLLRRDDEPSPVGRFAAGAAVLGALGVVLQVPLQASLATGLGWGAIAQAGVFDLAVADGVGLSTLLVAGGLVAIAITTGLPFQGVARALALAGAAAVPLGFAVTGHTRTMSPAAVGYVADVAHVAAGALWLGGLVAVVAAVRRRRAAGDPTGAAVALARFSGGAAVVVGAVVVAGTALGWIEVGGLEALTSTTYGRLLLAKVALVALVLVGAAWNRFRLVPLLDGVVVGDADAHAHADADADGEAEVVEVDEAAGATPPAVVEVEEEPALAHAWTVLLRVVRLEVLGLVAVLVLTGVLSNVTPAKDAVGSGIVNVEAALGEGSVLVTVDPARPGRNDVHAYLLDASGGVDDRYDAATMSLALPAQDIGPLEVEPVLAGPGHFQLVGTDLTLGGEWTLTITVKPDRFTEQSATVSFRVR